MSQTGLISINYGRNPSEVLRHFTTLELQQSTGSQTHFAQLLAANYFDLVPEASRSITGLSDWRGVTKLDELDRIKGNNKKQFNRYMNGNNIPVELLSAWMQTLEHFRLAAMTEITSQCGYIPAAITGKNQYENMSQMMRSFGDFIEAMSPIMRDSVIDYKDAPFAPEAVSEIDKLVGVLQSLREQIVNNAREEEELPLPEVDFVDNDEQQHVIGLE